MTKIPERFTWAVSVINPGENDKILEIGCGTGILLEQLASSLSNGSMVGVDKSNSFLQKAKKRNKKYIDRKNVELIAGEFSKQNFKTRHFDKIIAFNINLFLKHSAQEFELLLKILKPKGQLYVFYQMPYEIDNTTLNPVIKNLESFGFNIQDSGIKKMKPTSSSFIIATAR